LTTPISLTGTAEEIDAKFSNVLLQFVESHTGLQATFDRACTEISNAVKAIDERNKNKVKAKTVSAKAAQEDDPKTKPEDGKTKPEETLPLWWTDSSVAPPGVTAQQSAISQTAPAAGSQANSHSTNVQEVASPCQ
jgi:PRTRC genetic system protein E